MCASPSWAGTAGGMEVKCTEGGEAGSMRRRFWYIDSVKNGVKGAITCGGV